jgi:hypothetical protein
MARWRRNLYVLMLAVFVSFSGFTFVMPFLPLFIRQLGVTDTGDAALWSGLIFGVSPLLCSPRSGPRWPGASASSASFSSHWPPMPRPSAPTRW